MYPQGQVVLEQRHAACEQRVGTLHKIEGFREAVTTEAKDSKAAVRGNELRVIDYRAPETTLVIDANGTQEIRMSLELVGVDEVDTGPVGFDAEYKVLDIKHSAWRTISQRLERFLIWNGRGAVAEFDGDAVVHRVHAPQVIELRDVVDAVAVDVCRILDQVLLHPVALHGQRRHVLGERGRAFLA